MNLASGTTPGPVAPWFGLVQPWLPKSGGPSMSASPASIRAGRTTVVTLTGVGTSWTTAPPALSVAGVAGVTLGSVTVVSDAVLTAPVTTGEAVGTLTYTDATTGLSATQLVVAGRVAYPDPLRATATARGPDPFAATARLAGD